MKNAFMLLPVFFLNVILWVLFGSFFMSLSQPAAFYALAEGQAGFFLAKTAENALQTVPAAVTLAFSVVYIYIMRHKTKKRVAVPVGAFLFVLAAGILVPLSFIAGRHLAADNASAASRQTLPETGFVQSFRQGEKLLWLAASEDGTSVSQLLRADFSKDSMPRTSLFGDAAFDGKTGALTADGASFPVSHYNPEIETKLRNPGFLSSLDRDIRAVNGKLDTALQESVFSYLWIGGAFFAALASLFFLCVLTDWKLINMLIYAVALRVIYRMFPLFCEGEVHDFLRRFLPAFLPDKAVSALPVLLFALLLSVMGIAYILPRYRKENPGGAEA